MKHRIPLLIAVAALAAPVATHARLLVDAGDLRVSTTRNAPCGEPKNERTIQRGDSPVLHLAWGEPAAVNRRGRTVERLELVARIRVSDDVTVVRLNLIVPGLDVADSGDEPAHQAQF